MGTGLLVVGLGLPDAGGDRPDDALGFLDGDRELPVVERVSPEAAPVMLNDEWIFLNVRMARHFFTIHPVKKPERGRNPL